MASCLSHAASEVMEYAVKTMDKLGSAVVQTKTKSQHVQLWVAYTQSVRTYYTAPGLSDGRILVYGFYG